MAGGGGGGGGGWGGVGGRGRGRERGWLGYRGQRANQAGDVAGARPDRKIGAAGWAHDGYGGAFVNDPQLGGVLVGRGAQVNPGGAHHGLLAADSHILGEAPAQ